MLSYHELRSPDTVPLKRYDKSVKYIGGFYSSSDDKYTDDPPPCNRKNSKWEKMPKENIWTEKDISNEKQNDLKWSVPNPQFLIFIGVLFPSSKKLCQMNYWTCFLRRLSYMQN